MSLKSRLNIQYGSLYLVIYASKIVNENMKRREISNELEAIIARTAATLSREGITQAYSDRLVIELLGDEKTYAHRLLVTLAGEHGVTVIMRRIVRALAYAPYVESGSAASHYTAMCATLMGMLQPEQITSAHLLYAAAFDNTTTTSEALHGYGIAAADILREIERMQIDEEEVKWVS